MLVGMLVGAEHGGQACDDDDGKEVFRGHLDKWRVCIHTYASSDCSAVSRPVGEILGQPDYPGQRHQDYIASIILLAN